MSLSKVIRKYLDCWKEAVLMWKRPVVLLPFFLLALAKLTVLLLLRYFTQSPVSYFMVDIVRTVGGEASLHYPSHFVMLPYLYEIVTLPVIVVGFVAFGWGVFMMADHFDGRLLSPRNYIDRIVWNLPAFLFIGIMYAALAVSVPFLIALGAQQIESPFWRVTLERISWFLGFGARAALVYALLFTRLYRDDLVRALKESVHFALKRMVLTVLILMTVAVMHAPLNYLTGHSHAVVHTFRPERILYIIELGIVVEIFTNYFMFAATTFLAVGRKGEKG